jgi:hypothetical protein
MTVHCSSSGKALLSCVGRNRRSRIVLPVSYGNRRGWTFDQMDSGDDSDRSQDKTSRASVEVDLLQRKVRSKYSFERMMICVSCMTKDMDNRSKMKLVTSRWCSREPVLPSTISFKLASSGASLLACASRIGNPNGCPVTTRKHNGVFFESC